MGKVVETLPPSLERPPACEAEPAKEEGWQQHILAHRGGQRNLRRQCAGRILRRGQTALRGPLRNLAEEEAHSKSKTWAAEELLDLFLDGVEKNHSGRAPFRPRRATAGETSQSVSKISASRFFLDAETQIQGQCSARQGGAGVAPPALGRKALREDTVVNSFQFALLALGLLGGTFPVEAAPPPAQTPATAGAVPAGKAGAAFIEITPAARRKLQEIAKTHSAGRSWWLRINVKPGGCTGLRNSLDLDLGGPGAGDRGVPLRGRPLPRNRRPKDSSFRGRTSTGRRRRRRPGSRSLTRTRPLKTRNE